MWEIVFEGKFHPTGTKQKLAVLKRSEQYLNQNYFLKGIYKKKTHI
jgi:hypothetical protein